jgi:hypothetical protein
MLQEMTEAPLYLVVFKPQVEVVVLEEVHHF